MKKCPECRQLLDVSNDECYCGWQSEINSSQVNQRCTYTISAKRCPLNGGSCNSVRGANWYCSEHSNNLHDPERCLEIILNAEKNFEEIMDSYIDWKIKLHPKEYAAKKLLIKRLAAELKL